MSILTQGFTIDVREQGGVKAIYLATVDQISDYTEGVDGEISAITVAEGAFYKYELISETAQWSETYSVSEENHTHMYEQELSFFIPTKNAQKRNEILLMARNNIVVIVEENDGSAYVLGQGRGLILGGSSNSGASYEDRNGYELTLSGTQKAPAPNVDPTIIEGLLTPVV